VTAPHDQGGAAAPPAGLDVEAEAQLRQERYEDTDTAELVERLRGWAENLTNIDGRALLRATANRLEGATAGPPAPSSTSEKVRVDRLRRVAERQGYRLERNRRRDPRALDYGTYRVLAGDGTAAWTTAQGDEWLPLAEAEAFLEGVPALDANGGAGWRKAAGEEGSGR
jgi:hypothetical protein